MPHAFDGDRFGEIVEEAERLTGRAFDHERRLSALVDQHEHADDALLAVLRDVCAEAREQRQLAQSIVRRLAGRPERNGQRGTRVLVVDDSADNRDVAATVLESAGFDAMTASNGLEGLIVAHYALPSVVLMDIAMPVLGGIEAARLLKASIVTRSSPVIAYTATPISSDGPLGRLFADVVRKPATAGGIVEAVKRFVPAR